ncbi:MAG: peptide chain release factor N(5)-glutamine methyltransferase, partial [Clostridia bacterium]|nr:peptide chain release factor N(5)-glutamine methyltransferase [Clostridia bacterium]
NKSCSKTYIGGQAVLEGVMMRGKNGMAVAVRDGDGVVRLEARRLKPQSKIAKIPFVRGVVSFFGSLVTGVKILSRSAEVYGEDDAEPSKFEKWLAKTFKTDVMNVVTSIGVILGLAFSVGLFFVLPNFLGEIFAANVKGGEYWRNLAEGLMRIAIFVVYILLTSLLKDIRRTYMYHGAEHKTITCFEKGLPLTVENVRSCRRVHDRCGTTFMFFVMFVSIFVFSVFGMIFPWVQNGGLRLLMKIALLPLVAGISYELLKLLAKTDSPLVYIFKLPGLLLQKLTTKEPDDGMIEVAITAFEKAKKMDDDLSEPECDFVCPEKISVLTEKIKKSFAENNIDETDAEWIVSLTCGVKRSELGGDKKASAVEVERALKLAAERLTGKPLWYAVGNCEFYGYEFKTDGRALIPRPETEELVMQATEVIKAGDEVLDLCTGSGVIAATIKLKTGASVTATDISSDALALARENFALRGVEVTAVESDMFASVEGKFDYIVTNPPYIKSEAISRLQPEVKDYEPVIALDGGVDGLKFYRIIAEEGKDHLKAGGTVFAEIGFDQGEAVMEIFREDYNAEIFKDLEGNDRILKAVLK